MHEQQRRTALIALRRRAVSADELGFNELSRLGSQLLSHQNDDVHISLENLVRFEPSMVAPLAILLRRAQLQGNNIKWRRISPSVREIFATHNLVRSVNYSVVERTSPIFLRKLPRFAGHRRIVQQNLDRSKPKIWPAWTSFGLKEFSPSQTQDFGIFTKRVFENRSIPQITDNLRSKFFEAIDELFGNSALHAHSVVRHTVSGFFDQSTGMLHYAFADGGRGFKGSYEATYRQEIAAEAAIDWAMTPDSTTRQGDIPGGLGLKILRKFIRTNRGCITIVSQDGFWRERGGHRLQMRMPHIFPGTAIAIEMNTADNKSYEPVEASTDDVW